METHVALSRDVVAKRRLRLDGRTRIARRVYQVAETLSKALGREPNAVERIALTHAAACTALLEDLQARALRGDESVTVERLTKAANIARRAVAQLNLPAAGSQARKNGLRPLRWR
jgi:hypothetical protein